MALLLVFFTAATSLKAATFIVTNDSDDINTAGSLRWAIDQANTTAGPDIISFAGFSGTISLSTVDMIAISDDLTIDGSTSMGYAAGMPTVKIESDRNSSGVFKTLGNTPVMELTVLGLEIASTNTNFNQGKVGGVHTNQAVKVSVTDMVFTNVGNAVKILDAADVTVTNNAFNGAKSNTTHIDLGSIQGVGGAPRLLNIRGNVITNGGAAFNFNNIGDITIGITAADEVQIQGAEITSTNGRKLGISNCHNATIDGINVSYDQAGTTFRRGDAMNINNCDNLTIRNVIAKHLFEGIFIRDADIVVVENSIFENIQKNGLQVVMGSDVTIQNNTFLSSNFDAGQAALSLNNISAGVGGNRLSVSGNSFQFGSNALLIQAMDNLTIANSGSPEILLPTNVGVDMSGTVLKLANCDNLSLDNFDLSYVDPNGSNIRGTAISASLCDNLSVDNLTVDRRDKGIELFTCTGTEIINSSFSNVKGDNVNVRLGTNHTITNNMFSNGATNISATYIKVHDITGVAGSRLNVRNNSISGGGSTLSVKNVSGLKLRNTVLSPTDPEILLKDTDGHKSTTGTVLTCDNCDNLILENFDLSYVDPLGSTARRGNSILVLNSDGVTIDRLVSSARERGVQLLNCNTTSVTSSTFTTLFREGVRIDRGTGHTVTGNAFTDTGAGNGSSSIQLSNITGSAGNRMNVRNNTFSNDENVLQIIGIPDVTLKNSSVTSTDPEILLRDSDGHKTARATIIYANNCANLNLRDFDLSHTGGGTSGTGIDANNCPNLLIDNVTVGKRVEGIKVTNTETLTVQNCTVNSSQRNAISIFRCKGASILNNVINQSATATNYAAISLATITPDANGLRMNVRGNDMNACPRGFRITGIDNPILATSGSPEVLIADGDGLKECTTLPLYFSECDNLTVSGFDISFSGTNKSGTGMTVENCEQVTLDDITIGNRDQGASLDLCERVAVTNSAFPDLKFFAVLVNRTSDVTITDNVLTRVEGNSTRSAITLTNLTTNANTNKRLFVEDNAFVDCSRAYRLTGIEDLKISDGTLANSEVVMKATDAYEQVFADVLRVDDCDNVTIQGVNIPSLAAGLNLNQGSTAISVNNSSPALITKNRVKDRFRAINISTGGNIVLTNTTLSENTLEGNSIGVSANFSANSSDEELKIINNNFACNSTDAIVLINGSKIDASGNYWGAADGSSSDNGSGDTYNMSNSSGASNILNTTTFSTAPVAAAPAITVGRIALSGAGNPITNGAATASATNDTDFGNNVFVGTTVDRTFTISNSGGSPLNISSIDVTQGMRFALVGTLPTTVAGGATATFTVRYAPLAAGSNTATVTVNSDACLPGADPYTFTVSGTAVPACDLSITSATPTAEGCPGAADGSITVVATCTSCNNATTPITYTATPMGGGTPITNTDGNFTNLAAGGYTISVADTDDATCDDTFASTVTVAAGTDNTPPTFTCPSPTARNVVMNGDPNCAVMVPDLTTGITDAMDNCNLGTNTVQQSVSGIVTGQTNNSTLTVNLTLSDVAGNTSGATACQIVLTVLDQTAPTIALIGANPLMLTCTSGTYSDPGATATDNCGLSNNITVDDSQVDLTTAGTYPVTFNVMDDAGNAATQVTRNVVVACGNLVETGQVSTNFGTTIIENAARVTRTFTIQNTGNANVTGLSFQSSSADFVVGTPSTTTLAPNESATIEVEFDPSMAGSKTATIDVTSSSAASTQIVVIGEALNGRVFLEETQLWYATINDAITASTAPGKMFISPGGTYPEVTDFRGKNLTIVIGRPNPQ
ncbi:hypothetical protein A3850_018715 [Lewinella sp. 4G2]|nr:hypothetical protein A3850_018715 [Lewinella sp. 4G2]